MVVATACALVATPTAAQSPTDLTGSWTLDHQLSQFPTEIGFSASFIDAAEPQTEGGARGRRRGGGGAAGGGRLPFGSPQTETAEDAQRVRFLTDEARIPYEHLAIEVTPAMVTLTPDRGAARTLHPGRRDEEVSLGPVSAITNAAWEDNRLVIVYKAEAGRTVRYIYTVSDKPRQLVVETQFLERGEGDMVRRVYEPTSALNTSTAPAAPSTTAGTLPPPPGPGAAAPPPAVPAAPTLAPIDQRPDAALRGLTALGVVVEDLSPAAAKCGLKRETLESAVAERLGAAGFRVLRNTDDDTYLYVNVNTVSASASLCVSRYDVTLYSHTDGKLSYTPSRVLLQVELLHKGGIAGGGPAAHADGVRKGVLEYVDQFATRIQGANNK